jgi:hypothetical protein
MKLNRIAIRNWLGPIAFALSIVVIVAGTLQWPLGVVYTLGALMFAAAFGARHVELRGRRRR